MAKIGHLSAKNFYSERFPFFAHTYAHSGDYHSFHDHDFLEIVFVLSGRGWHKTLTRKRRIRTGDVYFIQRGAPHSYSIEREISIVNMITNAEFIRGIFAPAEYTECVQNTFLAGLIEREDRDVTTVSMPPAQALYVRRIVENIVMEMKRKAHGFETATRSAFGSFLIHVIRAAEGARHARITPRDVSRDEHIKKIMDYLSEHYALSPELNDIAATVSLNPSYLSRFFRQETGYTVFEYVNELRIQKACEHLRNSDKPILDIALDVGYNSISFFNRIFKRSVGMTPKHYRVRSRND
ncbi:MAG: helix-turn-helix transcriptional regulator [Spirochaetes bacterium]|nr:helix-turn-helix transcriptional regulator [Spirochaetota bacterium]